jgi:hypothetical protein
LNGWKLLDIVGMAKNGWKRIEMAGNGWNGNFFLMGGMVRKGLKIYELLEMTGINLK